MNTLHFFIIVFLFSLLTLDQYTSGGILNNEVDDSYVSLRKQGKETKCEIPPKLKQEISSYAWVANKIITSTVNGKFKGRTWQTLADFVDKFGSRLAGSKNLEKSIDYMLNKLKKDGLENVHGENAVVPHWIRGEESAELIKPRYQPLPILGLGGSVGTTASGITAEAIVVSSFEELKNKRKQAYKKIVIFNEDYVSYGETVKYRDYAAEETAKVGGVASLVRSVTPFSIASPHTGWQDYSNNVTKIPTACITIEDAEMLHRMYKEGEKLVIKLKMQAKTLPPAMSRNTVGELRGRLKPDEVVVVSGHLDSWDVGEGAMDDGGGAFISWNSLVILKQLGLRPRRTLRAILWTGEEEGLWGAQAYVKAHANETKKFDFVMESDEGTFTPFGLSFSGNHEAGCIVQEVLKLLAPINGTQFVTPEDGGPDIRLLTNLGIPGSSLINNNSNYFWFHHSNGDTMTVENSHSLDLCTAVWAVASYVIADLSVTLPK